MPRQLLNLTRVFLAGCVALALSMVLTSSATVGSKIFLVDSFEDVADAEPGNGICATVEDKCSLRAAIEEANARAQNDSIILPGGQAAWTYTLDENLGTLEISVSMSIQSPDRVGLRVIDGHLMTNKPVMKVAAANVLIDGLMITNGPLGGLVLEPGAELTLSNSTISQNAISGLLNKGGTLTLNNVTISGNVGTGLVNQNNSSLTQLNNSSVISNTGFETGGIKSTSGSLVLKNSVVAGNSALGDAPDCLGTVSSAGNNLLGNNANCEGLVNGENGDLVGSEVAPLDAHLGPLQDNGGPGTTHALQPTSPALNAGVDCLVKDQRGVPRPQGQACDMGAFEMPMAQFSATAFAQPETVPAVVTVTLDAPLPFGVSVNYETQPGTAQAGLDYEPVSGTLTFTNTTQLTFTVPITANPLYTDNKFFTVLLSGNENLGVDVPATAQVDVLDAQAPPNALMEASLQSVIKASGVAVLTATLDAASGVTATVNYTTLDDTAVAGRDYVGKSGQLEFMPGEIAKPITITVLNDGYYYGDRNFSVELTQPVSATLGTPNITNITIVDTNPRRLYLPLIVRPPEGYFLPCETEPNDNAAQANGPLVSGRDYCGMLTSGINNDFFYFKSAGGPLTAQLTGATTGVQLQLYYSSVSVANLVGFSSSAPFTITCPPGFNNKCTGAAGTYYVRVVTTATFGGGAYSLKVTFP